MRAVGEEGRRRGDQDPPDLSPPVGLRAAFTRW